MSADKIRQALDVLSAHNAWRRGKADFAQHPKSVGEAIDVACGALAAQAERRAEPDGYLYECGTAFGVHRQLEKATHWNGTQLSERPYYLAAPAPAPATSAKPVCYVNAKALRQWVDYGSGTALAVRLKDPNEKGFIALYTKSPTQSAEPAVWLCANPAGPCASGLCKRLPDCGWCHQKPRCNHGELAPSAEPVAEKCSKCKGTGGVCVWDDVDDEGRGIGCVEACKHCGGSGKVPAPEAPKP